MEAKELTVKDIWINFFKNLGRMENIDESVYERADEGLLLLIERAKIGALSSDEYAVYEASLKKLADEMDMEEHGFKKGVKQGIKQGIEIGITKGREEGILQIATGMKKDGVDAETISKWTNLTFEEIENL